MAEKKAVVPKKKSTSAKQDAFLAKVRQGKAVSAAATSPDTLAKALQPDGRPRLLFAMDATASREHSWTLAQDITMGMFSAVPGALDVALAYHGGSRLKEITPFSGDAKAFLAKVRQVRCEAGMTRLLDILDAATGMSRLKALIYVGDYMEEDEDEAARLAARLKLKGVRAFMFLEGDDVQARRTFGRIADLTGGVLLPFDESAPEHVKALLEAIAVYAVGGIKLLEQRQQALPAAKRLLEQMQK